MSSSAFAFVEERSISVRRVRVAWIVASLIPAIFVLFLVGLTFFASPEHDDFCMASRYLGDGMMQTVIGLYYELSGRVLPFVLIQLPAAIAFGTGGSLLSAYSLTMALRSCSLLEPRSPSHARGCMFAESPSFFLPSGSLPP